jgi:hypothetical protein
LRSTTRELAPHLRAAVRAGARLDTVARDLGQHGRPLLSNVGGRDEAPRRGDVSFGDLGHGGVGSRAERRPRERDRQRERREPAAGGGMVAHTRRGAEAVPPPERR